MQIVKLNTTILVGNLVLSPGQAVCLEDEKAETLIDRGHAELTEDPVLIQWATDLYEFGKYNST